MNSAVPAVHSAPRAWAYIRWSSKRQEKGDSLDRQTAGFNHFKAEFPEVEIVDTLLDGGLSAYHGMNTASGQLRHILDNIQNGVIKAGDYLIVESIDRLSRQRAPNTVDLLNGIIKKGVRFYTTIDKQLYSYDDEKNDLSRMIMFAVIAQRAYDESKTKSERAKSAHSKKAKTAEEGGVYGNIPFGYREWNGRYEIVPEEANELKRLFHLLKDVGLKQTVIQMNKGSNLKKWTVAKVEHLIKKEYVIGNLIIDKVDYSTGLRKKIPVKTIKNHYPIIIEEDLFNVCKQAMKGRATLKTGKVSATFANIFRHVLECECCGGNLYFSQMPNRNKTKNRYVRTYYCKRQLIKTCPAKHVQWELPCYEFLDFLEQVAKSYHYQDNKDYPEWEERAKLYQSLSVASNEGLKLREFKNLEEEYIQAKQNLDELNESVDGMTRIPKVIMDKLAAAEDTFNDLEPKYQVAMYELDKAKATELLTVEKVKTMLETEEGRIEINAYLKQVGLKFSFKIDEQEDTLFCAFKNGKMIYHKANHYPKVWHKSRATFQIEKYGFDFSEVF